MNGFMRFVEIAGISVAAYVLGGAVLFCMVSGPKTLLALPFLLVFGWFYFVPILLIVSLMWATAARLNRSWWINAAFVAVGAALWGCLAWLFGIKGPEPIWARAYVVAGAMAGILASALIVFARRRALRSEGGASSGV
jgi:hypothetical protein